MADTILTKKITDLPEGTEINDADLIMTGVNGTASLRKNKWSKFVEKLRAVLFVDSCSSTSAEYGLTAKQGKNLQDQIDTIKDQYDELNTNMIKAKIVEVSGTVSANVDTNIAVNWNLEEGDNLVAYFIERVVGNGNTTNITYCNFNASTNIRIRSTSTQEVSVTAVCLYR